MECSPRFLKTAPLPALTGQRIAVTGATGFVGRHLVHALTQCGAMVTCIVRRTSAVQDLPSGVTLALAQLDTGEGMDAALRGQDAVIHLAALLFGLGWQDYLAANALAARSLGMALAREMERPDSTLRRVVLISSLAATGPCALSPGVNDSTVPTPVSAYGWSKLLAEQVLGRAVEPRGRDRLVIVRPPIIYGSGDRGLFPYFQMARRGLVVTPGLGRRFPVSVLHVHDMVQAVLCALRPEARGVYHCHDGGEHDMGSIGQAMAEVMDRTARVVPMPLPVMGLAAAVCGAAGPLIRRCTGRAPSWNLDKYREARQDGWLCDSTRIKEELGFAPTVVLRDGLREAVDGYRKAGWL